MEKRTIITKNTDKELKIDKDEIKEKEYLDAIGITDNNKDNLTWLLEKSYEMRNFEIEKYWQRTNYFTVFVGALFVAYYQNINNSFSLKIVIEILGLLISGIWYLSNLGTKFWQENWEKHMDFLEKCVGNIHKTVLMKKFKISNDLLGAYPISPTKCNAMISIIITIVWGMFTSKDILNYFLEDDDTFCLYVFSFLCSIILFLIFIFIFKYFLKSGFTKGIKKEFKEKSINIYVRDKQEEINILQ